MTGWLLAALLAAAPPAPPHTSPPPRMSVSRLTLRERIILRVTARRAPAALARQNWRETRGPRCMPLGGIAGAAVIDADRVDFILTGGARLRARFERHCPALDFYAGFYLAPTEDGMICAGRDELRDRTGNSCGIDRFRTLVADPAAPPLSAPGGAQRAAAPRHGG